MNISLARHWWAFLLRGLVALIFAVITFIQPAATALVFVFFFGAYVLVDGLFTTYAAIRSARSEAPYGWLLASGLLGIVIGIVLFIAPVVSAFTLAFLVAFWALISGVLEIVGAVRLRTVIKNEWLWIIGGLASIALGIYFLAEPGAGLIVLAIVAACYATIFGVMQIGLGFRLRRANGAGVLHRS